MPLCETLPDGRWAFMFDNSMLSDFASCEEYFNLRHLRHRGLKGGEAFDTAVGSWWSDLMSWFYEALAQDSKAEAKEQNAWLQVNLALNKPTFLATALKLWEAHNMRQRFGQFNNYQKFCGKPLGAMSKAAVGTAFTLPNGFRIEDFESGPLLMADSYFENFISLDRQMMQVIATEAGFGLLKEILVGENEDVVVYYVGKPDWFGFYRGRLMPGDHKTVSTIDDNTLNRWKPYPQFPGYIYTTRLLLKQLFEHGLIAKQHPINFVMVNIAARNVPANPRDKSNPPTRFLRLEIPYDDSEIEEWRIQTIEKASRLRRAIEKQIFIRKETSCHFMYGRPCVYRDVCKITPSARDIVLKANYEITVPWVPYKTE